MCLLLYVTITCMTNQVLIQILAQAEKRTFSNWKQNYFIERSTSTSVLFMSWLLLAATVYRSRKDNIRKKQDVHACMCAVIKTFRFASVFNVYQAFSFQLESIFTRAIPSNFHKCPVGVEPFRFFFHSKNLKPKFIFNVVSKHKFLKHSRDHKGSTLSSKLNKVHLSLLNTRCFTYNVMCYAFKSKFTMSILKTTDFDLYICICWRRLHFSYHWTSRNKLCLYRMYFSYQHTYGNNFFNGWFRNQQVTDDCVHRCWRAGILVVCFPMHSVHLATQTPTMHWKQSAERTLRYRWQFYVSRPFCWYGNRDRARCLVWLSVRERPPPSRCSFIAPSKESWWLQSERWWKRCVRASA